MRGGVANVIHLIPLRYNNVPNVLYPDPIVRRNAWIDLSKPIIRRIFHREARYSPSGCNYQLCGSSF